MAIRMVLFKLRTFHRQPLKFRRMFARRRGARQLASVLATGLRREGKS
jgi:hypothetical protein